MDRKNKDEPLQPPRDLLSSILEKTSGPACVRAEALLAQGPVDDLEELDAQLVTAHADDCAACGALRAAFSQLDSDLPAMRELEPDERFADAVFTLTSHSVRPLGRPAERFRRLFKQLVQRPRFAWETAYVGALLFWLVLSLPVVSLPDEPFMTRQTLPDFSEARSAMQSLHDPVLRLSRRVWNSTHTGWSTTSTQLQQDFQKQTGDLRLEIDRGGEALVEYTGDARLTLQRFIRRDKTDTETDRSEP